MTMTINLDIADNQVKSALADGTLTLDEVAKIYEEQTGKTLDLAALAESGEELNIVIADSCEDKIKMDFEGADLDFLNITGLQYL